MEYWAIVFAVALMAVVFTSIVMLGDGVNARNHSLFVKILHLKARKADATEFGNAIFDHVMTEVARRGDNWNGKYDIRPAIELLDGLDFDSAYTVVVRRLLELGFHQISLDRRSKVLLLD